MHRTYLRAALGAVCLTALVAAGPAWAATATGEAPALAEQVKAGTLPPVAERASEDPLILSPQATGTYGGELRFGLRGSSDHNHILRMVGNQGLVRWSPDYTEILPNVAASYEVDPEGKVFTFHLRPGMKWSDGQPFTADDILFNMNDLVFNKDFSATPPRYMTGGTNAEVEKIDDVTVKFTFTQPYGDFLGELSTPLGQHPVLYAKHYCSQFLPQYNDKLDELVKANNASDWQNLLLQKCGDIEIPSRWGNAERPTLDPWVVSEPYTGGATRVIMKRNPYFWQVDSAGNQLPYIDQLNAPIAQDTESLILEVIGGRIDFGLRHLDAPANRPLLAQNREAGDYHFFEASAVGGSNMVIDLNLAHKNPEMRELFNQKDFRVALSLGINRQEVIDTALLGVGEPWQQGPFAGHPYHHEKVSTQYLEYDLDQANALLDGLGYTQRDANGTRLLPSGKPIKFQIDVIPTLQPEQVDMLQLVERQWAEIGIDMDVNALERTFFYERTSNSNDHDAAVWGAQNNWMPGDIPQQLVAVHHDSRWGIPWSFWYKTGGAEGEEPPETVKERMRLYDMARGTPDPEQRRQYLLQMADIAAEQFEVFGISKAMPTYGIVKNDLRNVPEAMPSSWPYATPGPTLPQTWFWQK